MRSATGRIFDFCSEQTMAEVVKIRVETRDPAKNKGTGTRVARRLRKAGLVPAVIYGHKQAVVPITIPHGDAERLVKSPGHLADLDVAGTVETVLIRDAQWDHLGKELIHLDFARVSAEEIIETEVPLEFRGHAAGIAAGGVLEPVAHTLRITCKAGAIPDAIKIDVSHLQVGEGVHVRDLVLPPDVTVKADADLLLVHCIIRIVHEETPAAEPGAVAAGEAPTQPEVIKPERKEKEKED
jgi:large subunit ribosomal protein L25